MIQRFRISRLLPQGYLLPEKTASGLPKSVSSKASSKLQESEQSLILQPITARCENALLPRLQYSIVVASSSALALAEFCCARFQNAMTRRRRVHGAPHERETGDPHLRL